MQSGRSGRRCRRLRSRSRNRDRTLVESLESRIAELETRLEFAERLMAKKE